MHQSVAYAVAILLLVAEPAKTRPSSEEVASAVKASFDKWMADHPPLTQAGAISAIQDQIGRVKADLERAKTSTGPNRKAKMKACAAEIKDLEKQLADTKRSYTPPEVVPRLSLMNWEKIRPGVVGRYRKNAEIGHYVPVARCDQILAKDRVLVTFELRSSGSGALIKEIGGMLSGVATESVVEGAILDVEELNLIVVGQHSYETAIGALRTVHAFEVFDPLKPFK